MCTYLEVSQIQRERERERLHQFTMNSHKTKSHKSERERGVVVVTEEGATSHFQALIVLKQRVRYL